VATQAAAQTVRQTFPRGEAFTLAKRNDSCWRMNSKLWGAKHTDGPYVAMDDRHGPGWIVWSGSGTAARLATEDEAIAKMRRLADDWREMTTRKVYFIGAENRIGAIVKIGVAYEPKKRLSALQTASHERLRIMATIIGDERLEGKLHRRYHAARVNGEWFRITPALRQLIKRNAEAA
jgi:hypothetical protein